MKHYLSYIGAFDRFNYGDLLFPIILHKLQEQKTNLFDETHFWGVQKSDLSKLGAIKTEAIQKMFTLGTAADKHYVIVCGGEVLPATWSNMYFYLINSMFLSYCFRAYRKIFGVEALDNLFRRFFKHKNLMPWLLKPEQFSANTKIVYNAVGGTNYAHFNPYYRNYFVSSLLKATYISVRDQLTLEYLQKFSSEIQPALAPDSAIIMSDFYDRNTLRNMISPHIKTILEKNKENYLCFQSSINCVKGKEEIIRNQLRLISQKTGLKIILFPIGLAHGHSNEYIINYLEEDLKNDDNFILISNDITIWDIMAIIAFSSGYLGTSLHGYITAMSFAVNRMGLHPSIHKLISFAQTWDIKNTLTGIEYDHMLDNIDSMLAQSKDESEATLAYCKTQYYINYDTMMNKLND